MDFLCISWQFRGPIREFLGFVLAILAGQLLRGRDDHAATKSKSHGIREALRLRGVLVAHRRVFAGPVNDLGGLGHSAFGTPVSLSSGSSGAYA